MNLILNVEHENLINMLDESITSVQIPAGIFGAETRFRFFNCSESVINIDSKIEKTWVIAGKSGGGLNTNETIPLYPFYLMEIIFIDDKTIIVSY